MIKGPTCFKGPRCFNGPGFDSSTRQLSFHFIVVLSLCNCILTSSNPIPKETCQNLHETSQHLNKTVSDEFNQTLKDHVELTNERTDHIPNARTDHFPETNDEVQNNANDNVKTTSESLEPVQETNDTLHKYKRNVEDQSKDHNDEKVIENQPNAEKINEEGSETPNEAETIETSNEDLEKDEGRKFEKRDIVDLKNVGNSAEDQQKEKIGEVINGSKNLEQVVRDDNSADKHETMESNKGDKQDIENNKENDHTESITKEPNTVLEKSIADLENAKVVHNAKSEPITKPGDKLVRQKSFLDSIKDSFQSYKTEDIEKTIPLMKTDVYSNKEHLWDIKGIDSDEKNKSNGGKIDIHANGKVDHVNKDSSEHDMKRTKDVKDQDHGSKEQDQRETKDQNNDKNKDNGHKELNKEEKKVKLQKSLNNVEEVHKMLAKRLKNDIYNPPGLNIDQEKHKLVKRKLKKLKSEKSAFELSVNQRYDETSRNLNANASTSFKTIEPDALMSTENKSVGDIKWNVRGKKDLARNLLANMKIQPLTGIGHSESPLSSPVVGPGLPSNTPFVWSQVPDHFSYLGLINVPEKYRTNDYERRLMSDYANIMNDVKQHLYGGEEKGRLLRHGEDMNPGLGAEPRGGTEAKV
ncbi:hypothetical protein WDU94_002003 [Cyamophila willieti]